MARRRNKGEERALASRRIDQLLAAARAERLRDAQGALPARYGHLALQVAQKYQAGLEAHQKAAMCRKCGADRSSKGARVRVRSGKLVVTCLGCGNVMRRPLGARDAHG